MNTELELAKAQILGYILGRDGDDISVVLNGLGLSKEELKNIREDQLYEMLSREKEVFDSNL